MNYISVSEAGTGVVGTHAEFDGALVWHCYPLAAGIAAIKQQSIGRGQSVEMGDQELPFAEFDEAA